MLESQLQDRIRIALGLIPGLDLSRNNVGSAEIRGYRVTFGLGPGSADLIGHYRGRFVAVEIKTPTGRQAPEQRLYQQRIERNGGIYQILRSVDEATAWAASLPALHRTWLASEVSLAGRR
jgi:hypothetical protein